MKKKTKKLNRVDLLLKKWYKILGWGKHPKTIVKDVKPSKKNQVKKNQSKHVQKLLKKADSKTLPWHKSFVESMAKNNPKIELAAQNKIEELQPYIDKVISALGHKDALVTDESYVTDFIDVFSTTTEKDKVIKKLSKKLKVKISVKDYVWQVAERLKNGRK